MCLEASRSRAPLPPPPPPTSAKFLVESPPRSAQENPLEKGGGLKNGLCYCLPNHRAKNLFLFVWLCEPEMLERSSDIRETIVNIDPGPYLDKRSRYLKNECCLAPNDSKTLFRSNFFFSSQSMSCWAECILPETRAASGAENAAEFLQIKQNENSKPMLLFFDARHLEEESWGNNIFSFLYWGSFQPSEAVRKKL